MGILDGAGGPPPPRARIGRRAARRPRADRSRAGERPSSGSASAAGLPLRAALALRRRGRGLSLACAARRSSRQARPALRLCAAKNASGPANHSASFDMREAGNQVDRNDQTVAVSTSAPARFSDCQQPVGQQQPGYAAQPDGAAEDSVQPRRRAQQAALRRPAAAAPTTLTPAPRPLPSGSISRPAGRSAGGRRRRPGRRPATAGRRHTSAGIPDQIERARRPGGGVPGGILGMVRHQAQERQKPEREEQESGDFVQALVLRR